MGEEKHTYSYVDTQACRCATGIRSMHYALEKKQSKEPEEDNQTVPIDRGAICEVCRHRSNQAGKGGRWFC